MRLLNRQFLILNLCLVHDIILASPSLLEFALMGCSGELADYYRHHLEQERGHDAMAREDLVRLGCAEIIHYHVAAQIAGSQYYMIEHQNPAMLLGYMHVLESRALNEKAVDTLENHHGVRLSCLRHHAKHDPGHTAELERQINSLPSGLKADVLWNAGGVLQVITYTMDGLWALSQEKEAA